MTHGAGVWKGGKVGNIKDNGDRQNVTGLSVDILRVIHYQTVWPYSRVLSYHQDGLGLILSQGTKWGSTVDPSLRFFFPAVTNDNYLTKPHIKYLQIKHKHTHLFQNYNKKSKVEILQLSLLPLVKWGSMLQKGKVTSCLS